MTMSKDLELASESTDLLSTARSITQPSSARTRLNMAWVAGSDSAISAVFLGTGASAGVAEAADESVTRYLLLQDIWTRRRVSLPPGWRRRYAPRATTHSLQLSTFRAQSPGAAASARRPGMPLPRSLEV